MSTAIATITIPASRLRRGDVIARSCEGIEWARFAYRVHDVAPSWDYVRATDHNGVAVLRMRPCTGVVVLRP